MCVNGYLLMYLAVLLYYSEPVSDVCVLGFGSGSVAYFSAMMYSVSVQMAVLPMYQELKQRSQNSFNSCSSSNIPS